ncbi:J domain-containing protein [Fulvivirga ligni]|uniref:J domain-containing protein n=1 Tax=Fulvivirga ligni TaxID=2904246 RepID=UPI001F331CF2|nr:J domain-containing protein [Fulvivirga ligni]UII19168.1 DnaJ domain-containing protein [Fulvivirga ligni]
MKDYYRILEIDSNASVDEIKRQFRMKALQLHPDQSKADTKDAFIELYEAFAILRADKSREEYDTENTSNRSESQAFREEIALIRQDAERYSRNFKEFNKKVILWIILASILDRNLFACVLLVFFGIWTSIRGVMDFNIVYLIIGPVMLFFGLWLGRNRIWSEFKV